MIFIIRDDRDDFDVDGITYYPEDHRTLTWEDVEESSEGSTEEEQAPAEEPEEEEW